MSRQVERGAGFAKKLGQVFQLVGSALEGRAKLERQARKIESYMTGPNGASILPGMLNFPLYGATVEVFGRGKPTAVIGDRIRRMMKLHQRPHLMPSFVDNHDVDRFLAGGAQV